MTVFKWTLLINHGYLINVLLRWICIKVKQCMDQLQRSSDTPTTGESFYKVESILVTWDDMKSRRERTHEQWEQWHTRTRMWYCWICYRVSLELTQCRQMLFIRYLCETCNEQICMNTIDNIFQTSYSLVSLLWGQFFSGSWRYPWQPSSLPAQHHEAKLGQHRKPSSPKQRRHFPWSRWYIDVGIPRSLMASDSAWYVYFTDSHLRRTEMNSVRF